MNLKKQLHKKHKMYSENKEKFVDLKKMIPFQLPQRQDSLMDQLYDLKFIANRLGMYDAADYLKFVINNSKT